MPDEKDECLMSIPLMDLKHIHSMATGDHKLIVDAVNTSLVLETIGVKLVFLFYEDLVQNQANTLGRLTDFLEVPRYSTLNDVPRLSVTPLAAPNLDDLRQLFENEPEYLAMMRPDFNLNVNSSLELDKLRQICRPGPQR
eukprot:CAMPEP_0198668520 /NCGR_PEP_ID=MMETSP1467-20131203/72651_1 /TAXON_ID=1462469 /ORGANISM="unid. sp., Strain CCMP2135" /LENGTH=139 /DNA_ID=CAMNT_0044405247 /DNA_START=221 /DNA_END=640 /DNA_ORIENTATION=+